jgi:hypothetical protein
VSLNNLCDRENLALNHKWRAPRRDDDRGWKRGDRRLQPGAEGGVGLLQSADFEQEALGDAVQCPWSWVAATLSADMCFSSRTFCR